MGLHSHTCLYITWNNYDYFFFMSITIISMPEYQNIINVVNSHCGLIAFWQETADAKYGSDYCKWEQQGAILTLPLSLSPLTLWTIRSRFGWKNVRFLYGFNAHSDLRLVSCTISLQILSQLAILKIGSACKHTRVCLFPIVQTQWCAI